MVGKEQIAIDCKLNLDDLNSLIKHENNSKVLIKLYFIKFRYLGDSVEEAAIKVVVTKKNDFHWQDYWSKGGVAALIPQFLNILNFLNAHKRCVFALVCGEDSSRKPITYF